LQKEFRHEGSREAPAFKPGSSHGTPFYVGKGKGDRLRQHEHAAFRGEKSHKANIIRKIIREGDKVGFVKFIENVSEKEALVKEVEMIKAIGRKPDGPLVNRTDGGEGMSGYKHEEKSRQKMSAWLAEHPEVRARTSKRMKESKRLIRWWEEHPEARVEQSKRMKGNKAKKETREKMSQRHKENHAANPEIRITAGKKISKSLKDWWVAHPEERIKSSERARDRYKDPNERVKISKRMTGKKPSAEARIKHSITNKNKSPEEKAAIKVKRMASWNAKSPEERAAIIAVQTAKRMLKMNAKTNEEKLAIKAKIAATKQANKDMKLKLAVDPPTDSLQ
jgi:hypothetical protein